MLFRSRSEPNNAVFQAYLSLFSRLEVLDMHLSLAFFVFGVDLPNELNQVKTCFENMDLLFRAAGKLQHLSLRLNVKYSDDPHSLFPPLAHPIDSYVRGLGLCSSFPSLSPPFPSLKVLKLDGLVGTAQEFSDMIRYNPLLVRVELENCVVSHPGLWYEVVDTVVKTDRIKVFMLYKARELLELKQEHYDEEIAVRSMFGCSELKMWSYSGCLVVDDERYFVDDDLKRGVSVYAPRDGTEPQDYVDPDADTDSDSDVVI